MEELISCAAGGDRKAQQAVLARFWPVIQQAVRGRRNRMGGKWAAREDTQDLTQQAALKVLLELPRHRWQGKSAFAAWVKKLARNEVVDAFRHHRAQKRDAQADTREVHIDEPRRLAKSAESRFDDQQAVQTLLAQVAALKAEYGAALMMHHLGFSMADIGEALNCTAEAARKLVARARAKLLAQKK